MLGRDAFGSFKADSVVFANEENVRTEITARSYDDGKTVVFEMEFPDGLENCALQDENDIITSFPSFRVGNEYYNGTEPRGFISFNGAMLGADAVVSSFDKDGMVNNMGSGLMNTSPLAIFNTKQTMVISSASNFMAINQKFDHDESNLSYGIMGRVKSVPKGFSYEVIVSLSDAGASIAMDEWGQKLLDRYQKSKEVAFSDFTTNYLQYSTDNGAYYYYLTEENKTYEDTIIDVKKYADKVGIPYRQWLMDSWWYFKGTGDGVKNWTAMSSIFPHGIEFVFDNTEQMPIVAHNRTFYTRIFTKKKKRYDTHTHTGYWSANTDYAKQNGGEFEFIIEPDSHQGLAMPTEQKFWDYLMSSSLEWGLKVYEQDWLYNEFSEMNCTLESVSLARQWLVQMGTLLFFLYLFQNSLLTPPSK